MTDEDLSRFLCDAIRTEIFDEGALVEQARLMLSDDPNLPLADGETAESVGNVIWERGDTSAIVRASKNCGSLQAYFYVARHFDLSLPPEVKALEVWGDAINPA